MSSGNPDQLGPLELERIYREVHEPVVRRGGWRLPDACENEDFLHDVVVRLLKRGRDADEIRNLKSYINKGITFGRIDKSKRKSRNNFSIDELTTDEVQRRELVDPRRNPEMQAESNDENRRMWSIACRNLNEREKALLALHVQGYSSQEIADRSGENVKAIRHDLNAIKAKIRYRIQRLLENQQPPAN